MARFHTSTGQFVGWRNLPNGVISIRQAVVRKAFGKIPRQPWIPFAARNALASLLSPISIVWEIGAGYSTLWLSDRVRHVTSIEAARDWYDRLAEMIVRENIRNIDLRFEWVSDRMSDFTAVENESLDLLFVDGGPRGECLLNGFSKVKRGGHIYCDNWDSKHFWGEAVNFPETHRSELARVESFVDYVPGQFGVYEGLLMRKH